MVWIHRFSGSNPEKPAPCAAHIHAGTWRGKSQGAYYTARAKVRQVRDHSIWISSFINSNSIELCRHFGVNLHAVTGTTLNKLSSVGVLLNLLELIWKQLE
jgi:hypothetical protein